MVVDDIYAVIGTVNLDYRSLFLHFECGVWLWKTASIKEMKNDFLQSPPNVKKSLWKVLKIFLFSKLL